MHELGITQSILEIAVGEAKRHEAKRIKVIRLSVGGLSHLNPDSLRFCFEVVSRGTLAEGAALEIERLESIVQCDRCGTSWTFADDALCCPNCGEGLSALPEGQELRVMSLEVE